MATLFLESGADPTATSASGAGPLLHAVCAAASRHTHTSHAAGAGSFTATGAPAAADASDVALRHAELLLCYGASASATNIRGEAAVDAAIFSGDLQLIRLLLAHGGRSTLSTPDGGSLLHAAAAARRADVLELSLPLLDDLGIEIDGADAHGQTALHVAVASADASLVVPLLRARATLDIAEGGGATALQMAVEAADLRCVSALVQVRTRAPGQNKTQPHASWLGGKGKRRGIQSGSNGRASGPKSLDCSRSVLRGRSISLSPPSPPASRTRASSC
jgi:ankyrin repeat protein